MIYKAYVCGNCEHYNIETHDCYKNRATVDETLFASKLPDFGSCSKFEWQRDKNKLYIKDVLYCETNVLDKQL